MRSAIPPAWQDVWISPYPNGHIQAVGTDEAGRRQYLYHDEWRIAQDADKHDRVRRLARRLPEFRAAVDRDLCSKGITRDRVLAAALRMLDHGVFRTGNTHYAEEYGSRGAATLLREDVRVSRGLLAFDFTAKGGIRRTLELEDTKLVDGGHRAQAQPARQSAAAGLPRQGRLARDRRGPDQRSASTNSSVTTTRSRISGPGPPPSTRPSLSPPRIRRRPRRRRPPR